MEQYCPKNLHPLEIYQWIIKRKTEHNEAKCPYSRYILARIKVSTSLLHLNSLVFDISVFNQLRILCYRMVKCDSENL